jgi:membrane protease YdiL (CAAX protease family)
MSCESPNDPSGQSAEESLRDECWRCGKVVDWAQSRCPFCAAELSQPTAQSNTEPTVREKPLMRTLAVAGIMVVVSVLGGLILQAESSARDQAEAVEQLMPVVLIEIIDTALVIWALVSTRIPCVALRRPLAIRLMTWLLAAPALVALLAANVGYHHCLLAFGRMEPVEKAAFESWGVLAAQFAIICIQPAIVEELFFRYQVLGVLRGVTGTHTAVMISAVMFGMAHLGVPLSIPVLILMGIVLGYARVASGGMVLPMLIHLLHNAAVLGLERMTWFTR